MTRNLIFFGPTDALSEVVINHFAKHGYLVEETTAQEIDFLDPVKLEDFLNTVTPDVVMIYPSWQGRGAFLESTTEQWETAMSQNIEAVTYLLQASAKRLGALGRGGRIIVLSHVAALTPFNGLSILGTTLAAVKALIKMLAVELAPHGVTVNSVAAGPLLEGLPQTSQQRLRDDTPLGGDANASLASLCLFLVSGGADHLTGQTLSVEGGFLLTRGPGVSPYAQ